MSVTIALIAIVVIVLLPRIYRFAASLFHQYSLARKLPGPSTLPLLGNAHQVGILGTDAWMPWFVGEAKKQLDRGETIMTFWNAHSLMVFPLDGKTAKQLVDSSEEIVKGSDYDFILPWLGTGLLLSTGDKWRQRRRMLTPTFHFNMLDGYVETFDTQSRILVSLLDKYAGSGEEVNVFPYVKRCALDIICETVMGTSVSSQHNPKHPYVLAVQEMNHLVMLYILRPWLWFKPFWILSGWSSVYWKHIETLTSFTKQVIQERRAANLEDSEKNAFLDLLLAQEGLTDEDVGEEVDTFMFEGHDTTSSGMGWILWCLACHPEIQQKAYEEIESVFGESDRPASVDDLKSLSFLDLVAKEAMRMFPPVPIVQRKLQKDLKMGDYLVPAGCEVAIAPMVMHYNEEAFPDPYRFDPDRFLQDNSSARHAYDYIPFSAGPRNCIGQKFASLEEKVLISRVLRSFKLSTDRPFLSNLPCPEVVLKPHLGVPVRLERR